MHPLSVSLRHDVPTPVDATTAGIYLLTAIALLGRLPSALRFAIPELGATNVVPVYFVADAIVHLNGRSVDTRATRRNVDELISSRVEPVLAVGEALRACAAPPPSAFSKTRSSPRSWNADC